MNNLDFIVVLPVTREGRLMLAKLARRGMVGGGAGHAYVSSTDIQYKGLTKMGQKNIK